jgi:hypothetical protein
MCQKILKLIAQLRTTPAAAGKGLWGRKAPTYDGRELRLDEDKLNRFQRR